MPQEFVCWHVGKLVPPTGFAAYRVEARLRSETGNKRRTEVATLVPPPFIKPAQQQKTASTDAATPQTTTGGR